MNLGDIARKRLLFSTLGTAFVTALTAPMAAFAQEAEEAVIEEAAPAAPAFEHYGPDMIKGQPIDGAWNIQTQYSPIGHEGAWMHNTILMGVMIGISLLILFLLLYVLLRYNKRANPVPSKTSHNTAIEVIWTIVPVFILLIIAVPSIQLLAAQYESPPEDAVTVKVTGYQWYWGYEYPDHGVGEFVSNMMPEDEARAAGYPAQLAVDNRMVVPVGVPIRLQIIGADVIHSFAVPSLWTKLDAVPGKLNETTMQVDEPGIYYGQCSELCGARHGFMPIAVEAVPLDRFEQWVASRGGTMPGAEVVEAVVEDATEEPAAEEAVSVEETPVA